MVEEKIQNNGDLLIVIQQLSEKVDSLSKSVSVKPQYYSREDVQQILGIGKSLMNKYIANGYISYSRPDGDKMFFSQADIDLFLKNSRTEAFHYSAYGSRS